MARIKKPENKKPAPAEFSSSPFRALKGVKAQVTAEAPGVIPRLIPAVVAPDDDELFSRAVAGVRPLNPQASSSGAKGVRPLPKPAAVPPEEQQLFLQAVGKLAMDVVFSDELPEDVLPLRPAASNRLRQLRRGAIRIDYELDLHGLTRDEALLNLTAFIAGAFNRGQKAVLVITGKGNNSPDGPVLQAAVSGWLREKGKGMVAEFAPAPAMLGGGGAFVVFLKEKKETGGE